jgi:hypothetical protein
MKAIFAVMVLLGTASSALAHGTNLKIRSADGGEWCFDAQGDEKKDGVPVFLYKCHGRENQRWAVTASTDGKEVIVGTGGFCLDVRGRHAKADGTPIQLWKCHFGSNQRFVIEPGGYIREVESHKCLQVSELKDRAPIFIDDCGEAPGQKWRFEH